LKMQSVLVALLLAASADAYRIGIIGGGVVGGGIAGIIEGRKNAVESASGTKIEIAAVCVRDLSKKRDWETPPGCEIVDDPYKIIGNKDIDLVVEVAGGVTAAKDFVFDAIKAGQDVVTANKALIAAHMPEIEGLLKKHEVQFGFEAAVLGGIPIIHSLQNDFVGDSVSKVEGIMNGCTNFMLTKMAATGCSYEDILGEAQALGFAEADPALDVGGQDARSKLLILIKLAFGLSANEQAIPCFGITELTSVDFAYCELMGGTIKLLGNAELRDDKVSAYVAPAFVKSTATLANIGGATNAIQISSENLGSTLLVGQGAGRFPTANSCVNDIVACAAQRCGKAGGLSKPGASLGLTLESDFEAGFYMRCNYRDEVGIVKALGDVCEKNGVSIFSMQQLPGVDSFVVITDRVKASQIAAVADELAKASWVTSPPFWMPACESD